jgi:hypothetical protein
MECPRTVTDMFVVRVLVFKVKSADAPISAKLDPPIDMTLSHGMRRFRRRRPSIVYNN